MHVPFCRHACRYCDFHFSTLLKQIPEVVEAMVREVELRLPFDTQASTLYWGGGTQTCSPMRTLPACRMPCAADCGWTLAPNAPWRLILKTFLAAA